MCRPVRGLIADVERKNGWQLAEHAGYAHPRGMQRVLARYAWDADAVRDDLRASVGAGQLPGRLAANVAPCVRGRPPGGEGARR